MILSGIASCAIWRCSLPLRISFYSYGWVRLSPPSVIVEVVIAGTSSVTLTCPPISTYMSDLTFLSHISFTDELVMIPNTSGAFS